MQNQAVEPGRHQCYHEHCHQIYIELSNYFTNMVSSIAADSDDITEAKETFSVCFSQYCYQDNLFHLLNGPPFKRYGIKVYSASKDVQRRRETFQLVQEHIKSIVHRRYNKLMFRERSLLKRNAGKQARNDELIEYEEMLVSKRQRAQEAQSNRLKLKEEADYLEDVKGRLEKRILDQQSLKKKR